MYSEVHLVYTLNLQLNEDDFNVLQSADVTRLLAGEIAQMQRDLGEDHIMQLFETKSIHSN